MKRLYRAISLLLALFALLPLLACGGQSEEVRDLPFTDITNGSHTWKVETCRLLTDGKERYLNGGAWTQFFKMDATHAEPRGYLAATQSPDGMIHLLSSRLHYAFNLAWIESKK